MALKQCEQCSEMVDEAKAFCPGCGNAFVDEKLRGKQTDFEAMGHTVQLGQTMYNQMLTDMGLNISKAPDPAKAQVEPITAADPQPIANRAEGPAKKGINKWVIIAIVAALLLFLAVLVILAAAVVIFYYPINLSAVTS